MLPGRRNLHWSAAGHLVASGGDCERLQFYLTAAATATDGLRSVTQL